MKNISSNIPKVHIAFMDKLVAKGLYSSRSEVIRGCIRNSLPGIFAMNEKVKYFTASDDIDRVLELLQKHGYEMNYDGRRGVKTIKKPTLESKNIHWEYVGGKLEPKKEVEIKEIDNW